jgi:hypothetical protein
VLQAAILGARFADSDSIHREEMLRLAIDPLVASRGTSYKATPAPSGHLDAIPEWVAVRSVQAETAHFACFLEMELRQSTSCT